MRTKAQVHVMTGHQNAVASLAVQAAEPQVISSSMDKTVRVRWPAGRLGGGGR